MTSPFSAADAGPPDSHPRIPAWSGRRLARSAITAGLVTALALPTGSALAAAAEGPEPTPTADAHTTELPSAPGRSATSTTTAEAPTSSVSAPATPAGTRAAATRAPVAPTPATPAPATPAPATRAAVRASAPQAPAATAPARAAATPVRYNACTGYADFARWTPLRQVLADTFTWRSHDPVKVGDGTGNINWRLNPYQHVSWYMWLHSLRWLGSAINAGRAGDADALAHATAIARDWVRDNPYSWKADIGAWESTMHRTNILLCLRQTITDRNNGTLPSTHAWLDSALVQHAEFMKANFSGNGNHGTDESLAMLGVGTTLGRPAYTRLAEQRLTAALGQAIDAEGGTNEQSTQYAYFNAYLWGRVAAEVAKLLPNSSLDTQVAARRTKLWSFIAHSITPTGTMFQIGNSEASKQTPQAGTDQEWPASGGTKGTPPTERTAAYSLSGFAFGRDTWGTDARSFAASNAYALRYGPRRQAHGHSDHTALAWYADGQPVLIDPGFGEYTRDKWQAFVRSPAAHNQLVIAGMTDSVATSLTRRVITGDAATGIGDYYQLVDRPGTGYVRIRDVLVMSNPNVVIVADRASAPRPTTFTQWWHLPPVTRTTVGRYAAIAANSPARSTTIVSLPDRGTPAPRNTYRSVQGASNPVQGWWWPSIFVKHAAPAVSINRTGRSAGLVTLIAYARPGAKVVTSTVNGRAGSSVTTVRVGTQEVKFGRSAGGSLYRVR